MFTRFTPCLLLFAALAHTQSLTVVPFHKNGIYAIGEKVGWTVTAPGGTAPAKYTYEIKKNGLDAIQAGALEFANGSATISATLDEPSTLYVTISGAGVAPIHLGAAIAPTQLQPSTPRPPDFDPFWLNKIRYLSVTPMQAVVTPVKSEQPGVELSTIQADCFGSRMHGYLAKPIKLGKFPALIMYHDVGNAPLDPKVVTDRAAEGWMAFDVAAHDMPPNMPIGLPPNFQLLGDTNRETAYLLFMYLRDARAVDYICSRYDWDEQTIVLMGKGMGGQQALVVAGIRPQVSAVIAGQPTGADITGPLHGRLAGFPYWPASDPRAMAAARYFDVVNFAPRIRGSVLASVGLIDLNAPAAGIYAAMNQVRGPKEVIALPDNDDSAFRARAKELLDAMLHPGRASSAR